MKGFAYVTVAVLAVVGIGVALVGGLSFPARTYGPPGLRFSLAFPAPLVPSSQVGPGGQRIAYVGSANGDELGASVLAFPHLPTGVELFSSVERQPGTTVSHLNGMEVAKARVDCFLVDTKTESVTDLPLSSSMPRGARCNDVVDVLTSSYLFQAVVTSRGGPASAGEIADSFRVVNPGPS
jgi:hypothetical protein